MSLFTFHARSGANPITTRYLTSRSGHVRRSGLAPLLALIGLAVVSMSCGNADKQASNSNSFSSVVATFEGRYSQQGVSCSSGKIEEPFASRLQQEQKSLDAGKTQSLSVSKKNLEIKTTADFFGSAHAGCAITDRFSLQEAPQPSPSSTSQKSTASASTANGSLKAVSSLEYRTCSSECSVDECIPIEKAKTEDEEKKRPVAKWTLYTKDGLLQTLILTDPPMCRNAGVATPLLRSWKKIP